NVGQIGHVQIDPTGPMCYCGKHGCLESVASDLALLAAAGSRGPLTMERLVAAADEGDERLQRLLVQRGERVGQVVATLAGMCDPERVVIAGFGARSEAFQLAPIREALARHM